MTIQDFEDAFPQGTFDDIVRNPLPDSTTRVVNINYPSNYRSAIHYFRAIMNAKEYSERALKLTDYLLQLNAANYTVWQYRRDILVKLGMDKQIECDWIRKMSESNPKNYQIWYHRQWCLENEKEIENVIEELNHLADHAFNDDNKNYHAWSYRQWILKNFNVSSDQELDFVEKMIDLDVRNNSAWNHRFFILTRDESVNWENELAYVWKKINLAPNNEAPYVYLAGICDKFKSAENSEIIKNALKTALEMEATFPKTIPLLTFIVETSRQHNLMSKEELFKRIECLATEIDPIRSNYWEYVKMIYNGK
ncbi:hypothetical protein O9G_002673 [Rozella allomycis CSF55]|uniref:Protein farnesyltransferase/geranylgeranyltransferase type-1 subunit alpha n=1 Tax=Rozella allomycis (strain CSF55) TaxID=988480 RepID=A0A075B453_ROZAC|nr:hypothetical protein O9G_002673 [Rozella allomycis CSF55]|eukprot:EPZ36030.1 hypothetical protein O9G_002673 [Rozella allomycis CSF55]